VQENAKSGVKNGARIVRKIGAKSAWKPDDAVVLVGAIASH
jgi:hypothetical protein